ncbi:MAG TPA: hypothetical protein VHV09_10890 [Trebonia sp.]|nr:hypothetical protein [Trebonia sp.]
MAWTPNGDGADVELTRVTAARSEPQSARAAVTFRECARPGQRYSARTRRRLRAVTPR